MYQVTDIAHLETVMLSLASLRVDAYTAWAIVSARVNKMQSRWQQASASYLSQRLELHNGKRIVRRYLAEKPAYKGNVPLSGTVISVTEPSSGYSDLGLVFSNDGCP